MHFGIKSQPVKLRLRQQPVQLLDTDVSP